MILVLGVLTTACPQHIYLYLLFPLRLLLKLIVGVSTSFCCRLDDVFIAAAGLALSNGVITLGLEFKTEVSVGQIYCLHKPNLQILADQVGVLNSIRAFTLLTRRRNRYLVNEVR
jgi:hypothetical protein